MISVANSGALVQGAPQSAPKVVKLEVARAFCIAGVRKEVGEIVEVPAPLAKELSAMGKAIAYVEKPAAPKRAPKEKTE